MIDRQKLETLLSKRFPKAGFDQIAAAANAIMGLDDEWEEVGAAIASRAIDAAVEFRIVARRTGDRSCRQSGGPGAKAVVRDVGDAASALPDRSA